MCPGLVLVEQDPAAVEREWEGCCGSRTRAAVERGAWACLFRDEASSGSTGARGGARTGARPVGAAWDPRVGAARRRFAALAAAARPGQALVVSDGKEERFLAPLPLSLLPLPADRYAELEGLGVRRLGAGRAARWSGRGTARPGGRQAWALARGGESGRVRGGGGRPSSPRRSSSPSGRERADAAARVRSAARPAARAARAGRPAAAQGGALGPARGRRLLAAHRDAARADRGADAPARRARPEAPRTPGARARASARGGRALSRSAGSSSSSSRRRRAHHPPERRAASGARQHRLRLGRRRRGGGPVVADPRSPGALRAAGRVVPTVRCGHGRVWPRHVLAARTGPGPDMAELDASAERDAEGGGADQRAAAGARGGQRGRDPCASTARRSRSCGRSGASSTAGGRRSRSTAATSTSCSSRAGTPASSATRRRDVGSASGPEGVLREIRPLIGVRLGTTTHSLKSRLPRRVEGAPPRGRAPGVRLGVGQLEGHRTLGARAADHHLPAPRRAFPSSATARRRRSGRRGRRRARRSAPGRPQADLASDLEQPAVLEGAEERRPPGQGPGSSSTSIRISSRSTRTPPLPGGTTTASAAGRPPSAGGSLGVEAGRHAAQVVGEAAARRVEVEVAHLEVAPVPEPVHDERRRQRERAGGEDELLLLGPTRNVSSPART